MFQFMPIFGQKLMIVLVSGIRLIQFVQRMNQGFGNETATVNAEMASGIRKTVIGRFKQRIGRAATTVFVFHGNSLDFAIAFSVT